MSIRLNWVASASASCFYAVARIGSGGPLVLDDVAAAVGDAGGRLRQFLAERGVDEAAFFAHLVPTAVSVAANRELAQVALSKTVGRERATALVELTAGLLTECEQAYVRAFPKLLDELELRFRPLREQWEARGPGLLAGMARRTDRRILVDEATVAVVQPVGGGGGTTHPPYNLITIDAVLANPLPQLPEVVRMAWLLGVLNVDLPDFAELLTPGRAATVIGLATLPPLFEAAADVELVAADDAALTAVVDAWPVPVPRGPATLDVVRNWWRFTRQSGAPWPVALRGLEQLLFDA